MSSLECELHVCVTCKGFIDMVNEGLKIDNEEFHNYECYDKKYSLEGGIF
jgi:hypothetical protein